MGGKDSFHRKRLRWRMQTFTMAVANVYDGGCKRLRERMQTFGGKEAVPLHPPGKYVQPFPQVRASEIEPKNIHTWQKVPHEHVVRDLPDSLSHGINPRCSLNHHLGLRRDDFRSA